jgi:spore coat polysaccharide biosynthesis predicted glycosyltransferase SpsG
VFIDIEKVKNNYNALIEGHTIILKFQASSEIGLGHLSRMITLANILKDSKKSVVCAINNNNVAIKKLIENNLKFEVNMFDSQTAFIDYFLEKYKPDTLVIDEKNEYDIENIKKWSQYTKLICIDNPSKNYKNCTKVIMPNAHFVDQKYPYLNNVVWGFDYVLISKEILKLQPKVALPSKIEKIVVITGGADPNGVLFYIIDWLKDCKKKVLLLYGESFKHTDKLKKISLPENFNILPYNPKLLLEADLSICTFGVSVYELIYLNIPIICIGHTKENANDGKILTNRCSLVRYCSYYEDIYNIPFKVVLRMVI